MSIEAIKKALEALEQMQSALTRCMGSHKAEEGDRHRALAQGRTAITALRTAIEQAEKQEPKETDFSRALRPYDEASNRLSPAAPVQEPVTDEQIKRAKPVCADFVSFRAGVRYAESRYKERQP